MLRLYLSIVKAVRPVFLVMTPESMMGEEIIGLDFHRFLSRFFSRNSYIIVNVQNLTFTLRILFIIKCISVFLCESKLK